MKTKSYRILQLFLLFLIGVACSSAIPTSGEEAPTADDEANGSVSFAQLTAPAPGGGFYCVEGKLQIRKGTSEVGGGAVIMTLNTKCSDASLSAVLRTGTYYITLASGYKCSVGGKATECTLQQPTTFTVTVGKTTKVSLNVAFNVEGQDEALVVFSVGGADITLDPSSGGILHCGPGLTTGPECDANSVCASLNLADPECYRVCRRDIDCPGDLICVPVVQKDQIWSSIPVNQLLRLCQSPNDDGGTGGQVCAPGVSQGCTCTDGRYGAQVCNSNGSGYNACQCTGTPGTGGTSGSGGTGSTGSQNAWRFEYTLPYDVPSITNVILSVIPYSPTYNNYSGRMYIACSAHSATPSEVFVRNGLTYSCTSMMDAGFVPETDVLVEGAGVSQFPNGGQYVDSCWGQGTQCNSQSCFVHFGTLRMYRNDSLVSTHDVSNKQFGCNIRPY